MNRSEARRLLEKASWIRDDLEAGRVTTADLVRVTLRYGNAGTMRRVGALLEREGASTRLLNKLAAGFTTPRTIIPWVPNAPRSGEIMSRWRVQMNARA